MINYEKIEGVQELPLVAIHERAWPRSILNLYLINFIYAEGFVIIANSWSTRNFNLSEINFRPIISSYSYILVVGIIESQTNPKMGTCFTQTAHVCEAWCSVRIIKLEGFATNNRDYNMWLFSYTLFYC